MERRKTRRRARARRGGNPVDRTFVFVSPNGLAPAGGLGALIPPGLSVRGRDQRAFPALAKDSLAMAAIERAVQRVPTSHQLMCGASRKLAFVADESVHLVLTSPPSWN